MHRHTCRTVCQNSCVAYDIQRSSQEKPARRRLLFQERRTFVKKQPLQALVVIIVIVALSFLAFVFIGRWRQSRSLACDDGERQTIDMNDFATHYFSYGMEWQAEIKDEAKFAGKLAPVQLQQMSDSLQSANEFRKTLVAAYNSCAIKKADESFPGFGRISSRD